jgi:signal peptidase I
MERQNASLYTHNIDEAANDDMIEDMSQQTQKSIIKDIINLVVFIILVVVGVMFINAFIFRSFNVEGPSMEATLYTGDKLIVNKIPVTFEHIRGKEYIPKRGQVIVFKNPLYSSMQADEYIVKRVIALPGERVIVKDGVVTVYNRSNPKGFSPDTLTTDLEGSPTSGDVNRTVPKGELFVSGDHRQGSFSLDSRNGLGTVPLYDVIGPVGVRVFPFQTIRTF